MSELSLFLPASAYLFHVLAFSVGWLFVRACSVGTSKEFVAGYSIIAGFGILGLAQWVMFGAGEGGYAWILVGLISMVLFALRNYVVSNPEAAVDGSDSSGHKSSGLLAVPTMPVIAVLLLILLAFLISQSSGLGESDPRFQWGFRAKILSTYDGFDNPFFQLENVYHVNPHYPLLYSAYEALMLRMLSSCGVTADSFRTIPVLFFGSLLLLLVGVSKRHWNNATILAVLAVLVSTPRFWTIGIDENYVDFPLGVVALSGFVLLADRGKPMQSLSLTFMAFLILCGLKMEAIILTFVLVLVVGIVHGHSTVRNRSYMIFFAAIAGALAAFILNKLTSSQINPELAIENVTASDLTLDRLIENLERIPKIYLALAAHYFDVNDFGLLLPMTGLSILVLRRSDLGWGAGCSAVLYLVVMGLPFIVSDYANENYLLHIDVVANRFFIQVMPLCLISIGSAFFYVFSRAETARRQLTSKSN